MRYQKWGKAGNRFICYYQQSSKTYLKRDPNCDNERPWAETIEEVVIDAVFRRAKQHIEEDENTSICDDTLKLLEAQRIELSRKLKRLYNLYASGDDVLLSTIDETKGELSRLDDRIELEANRTDVIHSAIGTQTKLDTLSDCWKHMTTLEKREILRSVINNITIVDNNVHVDFKY